MASSTSRSAGSAILPRKEMIVSAALFATGTGFLYLLDIYVAAVGSNESVATYAFARNVVLFVGAVSALGVDQVLIRNPAPPATFMQPAFRQVAVVALLGVAFVASSGRSVAHSLLLYPACISVGMLTIIAGYYRSFYRVSRAILAVHIWKLPLGALIAYGLWTTDITGSDGDLRISVIFAVVTISWALLNAVGLLRDRNHREKTIGVPVQYSDFRLLGRRFLTLAIIASGISYGDQILLNIDSQLAASREFFSYTALFSPLTLFVTGYLANLAAPYLRSKGDDLRRRRQVVVRKYVYVGVALVVGSTLVGLGLGVVLDRFGQGVNWWLVAAVTTASALRYAYLGPSAVVGLYGTRRDLDSVVIVGLAAVCSYAGMYVLLRLLGVTALTAISVCVPLTVGIRTANAWRVSSRIIQSEQPLRLTLQ